MNLNYKSRLPKLEINPSKNKSLSPVANCTPTISSNSTNFKTKKLRLHQQLPNTPNKKNYKASKAKFLLPNPHSSHSLSPLIKSPSLHPIEKSLELPKWLLQRSDFQSVLKSLTNTSHKFSDIANLSPNKSQEDKKLLFDWISTVNYFSKYSKKVLMEICQKLSRQNFKQDECLIRKGETSDNIFIVFSGKFSSFNEENTLIDSFSSKDILCEEVLSDQKQSSMTIKAQEATVCLRLTKIDYDSILINYKKLQKQKNCKLLMNILFFKQWTTLKIQHLCNFLVKQKFNPGAIIFEKGDQTETFFIIKSGAVSVQAHVNMQFTNRWPTGTNSWKISEVNKKYLKNICLLRPEQYFGESDLISQQNRSYRAVCEEKVVCLTVNKFSFFDIFTAKDLESLGKMSFVHLPSQTDLEKMLGTEICEKELNVTFI